MGQSGVTAVVGEHSGGPLRAARMLRAIRLSATPWNTVAGFFLLGLFACVPLALATGTYLYFDITPKVVGVLLCGAIAVVTAAFRYGTNGPAFPPAARWFCIFTGAQACCLTLATFNSVNPALSLAGSTWRRFGLLPRLAIAAIAVSVLLFLIEDSSRLRWFLRLSVAAGLIAALYGIAQYFGFDPWIPVSGYRETYWGAVRPPSFLGHASFFATFEDLVFFLALALARSGNDNDRLLGGAAAGAGVVAIVLSGTRAGLIGLVAGAVVFLLLRREKLPVSFRAVTVVIVLATAFSFSGPGALLRNRMVEWMSDARGGARLPLWRDTLRMGFSGGFLGFGPETFSQVFPLYQSDELARNFPNHYHESPHNVLLDVWTEGGWPGLAVFVAILVLAFYGVKQSRPETRPLATLLFAALAAMFVALQFTPLTISCGLFWMATVAALVSLTGPAQHPPVARSRRSAPLIFLSIAVAVVFAGAALRYDEFDSGLRRVAAAMKNGHIDDAIALYTTNAVWTPLDQTADLWFSRTLVASMPQAKDMMLRRRAWEQAIQAAERATAASEERANAYYHLAALRAFNDELPKTEQSIRMAIAFAPKWYKPHVLLARILAETGRPQDAAEQRLLAERFGGKAADAMDPEIPTNSKPNGSTSDRQESRP